MELNGNLNVVSRDSIKDSYEEKNEESNTSVENLMETVDVTMTDDDVDSNVETEIIELGINAIGDDSEPDNILITDANEHHANLNLESEKIVSKMETDVDTDIQSNGTSVNIDLKSKEIISITDDINENNGDHKVDAGIKNDSKLNVKADKEMETDIENNSAAIKIKTQPLTGQYDVNVQIEHDVAEADFKGFESCETHPLILEYRRKLIKTTSFVFENIVHEEVFEYSDDNMNEFKGFEDNPMAQYYFEDDHEVFRAGGITNKVIINRMLT